ncbi:MAG: FAD-dependent oxidoreductase [Actinomycetota bacterium]|nr:FAD-dependent oxidoreductase [Actinomycetota bacterium]
MVMHVHPLAVPDDVRASFGGRFLESGEPDYDEVRRLHNGMIDKHPALIAQCRSTADVTDALSLARSTGAEIAVRAGGHGVAGRATTDGGLMIDLASMKGIHVDPRRRTVRAEPGLTWREFNRAAAVHGLATTGGVVSSTGIAGLTLGGGIGWLMGRYGLTVDNLISAEVVTAAGGVLTASDDEHADLFWALRGGGGNFGVVTSFEYSAHPVREVLAGPVLYPLADARAALTFHREFTATAPDELTVGAALIHAPDGSGTKVVALVPCHCGQPATADDDVRPLRGHGTPMIDLVAPMPYPMVNTLLDPMFPKGALNYWKSGFLPELSDEAIDMLVEAYGRVPSTMTGIFLDHIHGAATRVDSDATAFPHRQEAFSVLILGQWADRSDTDATISWVRETFELLQPHLSDARYTNFLAADDTGAARQGYGNNYKRLAEIKHTYDPDNLFHLNHNIEPRA